MHDQLGRLGSNRAGIFSTKQSKTQTRWVPSPARAIPTAHTLPSSPTRQGRKSGRKRAYIQRRKRLRTERSNGRHSTRGYNSSHLWLNHAHHGNGYTSHGWLRVLVDIETV